MASGTGSLDRAEVPSAVVPKVARRGERAVVIDDDGLAPDVKRGDVLCFVPVRDLLSLRRGDIVLIRLRGHLLARRFHARTGAHGARVGDSVGYEDQIPISDVLGRAVRCVRKGETRLVWGARDEGGKEPLSHRLRGWMNSLGLP